MRKMCKYEGESGGEGRGWSKNPTVWGNKKDNHMIGREVSTKGFKERIHEKYFIV